MSFVKLYSPLELRHEIAAKARKTRISRAITQAALASATGVGLSTISRFERGGDVALSVVIAVAFALGTEASLVTAFPEPDRSFDELVVMKRSPVRVRKAR